MNEEEFKQALQDAYPLRRLEDERMEAIARAIRLRSTKNRRRTVAGLTALALGLAATAGFTYPIAAANQLGPSLLADMEAQEPYLVSLTFLGGKDSAGVHFNHRPMKMIVDGQAEYLPDMNGWPGTFGYVSADTRLHFVHPASNVSVVTPPQPGMVDLYETPFKVMRKLWAQKGFDFRKRIENRGIKFVNGKQVQELVLRTDGKVTFIADLDSKNHTLVSMVFPTDTDHAPLNIPARFDYDFDREKYSNSVKAMKSITTASREIDLDRDRASIRKDAFSVPLGTTFTGRDRLRIYQVQEDPAGDVFVLYSCDGAHRDGDRTGDWLHLKDSHGTEWLTSIIDLDFSELAPKGQGAKAQVFYHPLSSGHVDRATLSIPLDEWEYLSSQELQRPTRTLNLGTFLPTKVDCVPTWYFYAFGIQDELWVKAMGQKLRLEDAIKRADYRRAIQIGQDFDMWFPEDMTQLWYSRADLYRRLSEAYKEVGDTLSAAKAHERSEKLYGVTLVGSDPTYINRRFFGQKKQSSAK